MNAVEQIAAAVLYEGYLLWPYRRSARKNQKRWTFGGVYPRRYSEAGGGDDPWLMQTQCLVVGDAPVVAVKVRFLQVVRRQVGQKNAAGALDFVDELQLGRERYLTWDEAMEREVLITGVRLPALTVPRRATIAVSAGSEEELLFAADGEVAGALVRSWRDLQGVVEISARPLQAGLFRLTVKISNDTPWQGQDREESLRQTFASTHTILTVTEGEFVSLMDPPADLKTAAEACENIKTWPVLVGEEGDRRTMLSSPIILYDYPRIAPESPGDFFDGTEIDQLLLLNILTLTDEEKEEMRATDPRAREILERSESLSTNDFMQLHGAIREFRTLPGAEEMDPVLAELERPAPSTVTVDGVALRKGSRVRLQPRSGADVMDVVLAGMVALVEAIEQDYEGRIHLAVVLEDDPGRDLGLERQPGHRFFFSPDEVEPLGQ
jgi:hypothetical protein